MSLPSKHWYISLSVVTYSLASPSLWLGSIDVLIGLRVDFLVSLRRSATYFCWEIKIPCLKCAASILRKYFNLSLVNHYLKVCLSFSSFPVMMMSFTCTNRVVIPLESECLMNNIWSPSLCLYPMFFITLANLPNHLGDCFSSYRVYFSLHTYLVARSMSNLGVTCI